MARLQKPGHRRCFSDGTKMHPVDNISHSPALREIGLAAGHAGQARAGEQGVEREMQ